MEKFYKRLIIFILIILLIIGVGSLLLSDNITVVLNLNESSCESQLIGVPYIHDYPSLNKEITQYVSHEIIYDNSTVESINEGVKNICKSYGFNNIGVHIHSQYGDNVIPIQFQVEGNSMVPTFLNGETVIVEKTKNISVGDVVVADDDQYGRVIKRVGDIQGDSVYLISDNTNVEYENINGVIYEMVGLKKWTSIDNIVGIVIESNGTYNANSLSLTPDTFYYNFIYFLCVYG